MTIHCKCGSSWCEECMTGGGHVEDDPSPPEEEEFEQEWLDILADREADKAFNFPP